MARQFQLIGFNNVMFGRIPNTIVTRQAAHFQSIGAKRTGETWVKKSQAGCYNSHITNGSLGVRTHITAPMMDSKRRNGKSSGNKCFYTSTWARIHSWTMINFYSTLHGRTFGNLMDQRNGRGFRQSRVHTGFLQTLGEEKDENDQELLCLWATFAQFSVLF